MNLVMQAKIILEIRDLKRFAVCELPIHSLAREVIVTQPDEMSAVEFMAQARTWLQVLLAEQRHSSR